MVGKVDGWQATESVFPANRYNQGHFRALEA